MTIFRVDRQHAAWRRSCKRMHARGFPLDTAFYSSVTPSTPTASRVSGFPHGYGQPSRVQYAAGPSGPAPPPSVVQASSSLADVEMWRAEASRIRAKYQEKLRRLQQQVGELTSSAASSPLQARGETLPSVPAQAQAASNQSSFMLWLGLAVVVLLLVVCILLAVQVGKSNSSLTLPATLAGELLFQLASTRSKP